MQFALRVFIWHFWVSLFLALCAMGVIFGLWFPYPYREISGGSQIFLMVIGVDAICGPTLIAIIANPKKSKRELIADFFFIGAIQLAALGYGIFSAAEARPVVLAFEVDRMVAVSASEIDPKELVEAPMNMRSLSWKGPQLVGTRKPSNSDEMLDALDHSLQGLEPSARPSWWQDVSNNAPDIRLRAKKVSDLVAVSSPESQILLNNAIEKSGLPVGGLFYLPLTSRWTKEWVVLFAEPMNIVGYASVDGFSTSAQSAHKNPEAIKAAK
ncbi:hypothetical protein J2X90_003568 [Variovorax paradoxus]|uniref:hypothetical protein n=1 Tax=Variovorax paradoxus TaxID=34073 RepID=UPI0027813AA1|nr:hypothetical protein [Variovorax paradoxus]MDQ0025745.1 hypothetical protein [Variovorax paradoxus]